jgi:hypothetical protein
MVLGENGVTCFTPTAEVIHRCTETTFGEDDGRPLSIRRCDTSPTEFQQDPILCVENVELAVSIGKDLCLLELLRILGTILIGDKTVGLDLPKVM